MTKRLVVFVDKNGVRHVSPEYNGDKEEREFFGIGKCEKTWDEIKEIYNEVKTYNDFVKTIVKVASFYSADPECAEYRNTTACKLRKNQEMFVTDEIFYIYEKDDVGKVIVPDIPNERKAALYNELLNYVTEIAGRGSEVAVLKRLGFTADELCMEGFVIPIPDSSVSDIPLITISAPFGDIYIQSEIDVDDKVRIYDSRKQYLSYLDGDFVLHEAEYEDISVKEFLVKLANRFARLEKVEDLFMFIGDFDYITDDWNDAAAHLDYSRIFASEEELLSNEYVNKIGKWYVIIPE